MQTRFDLVITADYPNRTAELRLLDGSGAQLHFRHTDFKTIPISRQQGLFDLRNFLRHYVEPGDERASVAEIGVCIAEEVLGEAIFRTLWASEARRTLCIHLPAANEEENHLAAALARVPWEIARPAADQPTLGGRRLLVCIVHDMDRAATQPLTVAGDECLRVLFVFAEAPGSRPLAARQERRQLQRLFEQEIYPERRIVADFLTHGGSGSHRSFMRAQHSGSWQDDAKTPRTGPMNVPFPTGLLFQPKRSYLQPAIRRIAPGIRAGRRSLWRSRKIGAPNSAALLPATIERTQSVNAPPATAGRFA